VWGNFLERGRGAPHLPPRKIFQKHPHKNAIKHDPLIFSHPKYPPKKNCPKKPRTPPLDFQLLCIYGPRRKVDKKFQYFFNNSKAVKENK
jgi:hypothetical protein